MIAIINISKPPTPKGDNLYRIQINHRSLITFKHKREEGLAECLRKAAKAAEIYEENEKTALADFVVAMSDFSPDL